MSMLRMQWKFGSFYYRFENCEDVNKMVEHFPDDRLNIDDDF